MKCDYSTTFRLASTTFAGDALQKNGSRRTRSNLSRNVYRQIYQRFSRIFRYSIFIGGPTCTCMPINPSSLRFGASSSTVMLIKRPLRMCVAMLPRAMMCAAFQSDCRNARQLVRRRERREHDRRPAANHVRHLAAHGEKQPSLLFVVVAVVPLAAVEIELITLHRELVFGRHRIGHDDAAIVDAAVARFGDAIVELQLEVGRRAAAPDDERVALDDRRGSDLADEHAVLCAPVRRCSLPNRRAICRRRSPGIPARRR